MNCLKQSLFVLSLTLLNCGTGLSDKLEVKDLKPSVKIQNLSTGEVEIALTIFGNADGAVGEGSDLTDEIIEISGNDSLKLLVDGNEVELEKRNILEIVSYRTKVDKASTIKIDFLRENETYSLGEVQTVKNPVFKLPEAYPEVDEEDLKIEWIPVSNSKTSFSISGPCIFPINVESKEDLGLLKLAPLDIVNAEGCEISHTLRRTTTLPMGDSFKAGGFSLISSHVETINIE